MTFTGPLVETFVHKGPIGFYFNLSITFTRTQDFDLIVRTGQAQCRGCMDTMKIEDTTDLYEHLFYVHRQDFLKCVINADDESVYGLIDNANLKFVKEDVKYIAFIADQLATPNACGPNSPMAGKIIRQLKHLFQNRNDSKLFVNEKVFGQYLDHIEKYIGMQIVL